MNEYEISVSEPDSTDVHTLSVSAQTEDGAIDTIKNVYGDNIEVESVTDIDEYRPPDTIEDISFDSNSDDLEYIYRPKNSGYAKNMQSQKDESDEETPATLLESNAELYREKNEDYGDAWRIAGETLAMWATELDAEFDETDGQRAASWNLYMQRLHKLIRGFNIEFTDTSVNNETASESHRDASTYAGIHAVHVKKYDE